MPRTRKNARLWTDIGTIEAARRVIVPKDSPLFSIDPDEIFPKAAPLEVEIGAGRGDFIIGRAEANPSRNFLAVERPGSKGQLLAIECGRVATENLKVAKMDARTLVCLMLPDSSVAAYHVYFPDPWPKRTQAKHRLFGPHFVQGIARTLAPDGIVYVATDLGWWAREMFDRLEAGGFTRVAAKAPGATLTGFARKYTAQGKEVFSGAFERPDHTAGLQCRAEAWLKADGAR